jgi:hypothetical protein
VNASAGKEQEKALSTSIRSATKSSVALAAASCEHSESVVGEERKRQGSLKAEDLRSGDRDKFRSVNFFYFVVRSTVVVLSRRTYKLEKKG